MNWEAVSAAAAVFVPAGAAFGAIFWRVHDKLRADIEKQKDRADDLDKRLAEHKLHVAENYVTNSDLTKAVDAFTSGLKEIFGKLERINERLDSKADKDCHR